MKVRDADNAVVEIAKLRLYCLDPRHPRGACKAKQFAARLGLHASDAEDLCEQLTRALGGSDGVTTLHRDEFGQRYQLDVEIKGPKGAAKVRSAWITRAGDRGPRFLTCHVL